MPNGTAPRHTLIAPVSDALMRILMRCTATHPNCTHVRCVNENSYGAAPRHTLIAPVSDALMRILCLLVIGGRRVGKIRVDKDPLRCMLFTAIASTAITPSVDLSIMVHLAKTSSLIRSCLSYQCGLSCCPSECSVYDCIYS